ncbi:MAG: Asp-tRNA(Asn)/Glu-tRNA(Gln) amidotransferase GatCAB subunit A, partial [Actinobacteria bacterium]|nr:Asp-tRNA(Asn)/Glu-tRNA(Gln) amidotransferase GatCAB subunit A [Actinomycetota bacterium]
MPELHWTGARELGRMLDAKEISSVEVTQAFIDRSEQVDPKLHAYLEPTHRAALDTASAADKRISGGEKRSSFDGVPIAYKDIFCTKGVPTTSGSRILENFIPPY